MGGKISRREFGLGLTAMATPVFATGHAQASNKPVLLTAGPQKNSTSGQTPPAPGASAISTGPVLRVRKGEELFVRLQNNLASPSALHWRGVRGPNAMDGVPGLTQDAVAPGQSFDYRFTPPDAGTFIYRDFTGALAGVLIVEPSHPPDTDSDIVLAFDEISSAVTHIPPGTEARSTSLTVNGRAAPQRVYLQHGARVRLRIANLTPGGLVPDRLVPDRLVVDRLGAIVFSGANPSVVAIDSQPCELFMPAQNTLPVAPGTRIDLIFDLPDRAGQEFSAAFMDWPVPGKKQLAPVRLLSLVTKGQPKAARKPVEALPRNPLLPEKIRLQDARRMDLVLSQNPGARDAAGQNWSINNMSPSRAKAEPLFRVKRGRPVSLGFINRTASSQVMRVHGHSFRLLHRLDDGWDPYWLDTLIVPAGRTARIAFVADNPGKWLAGSGIGGWMTSGRTAWFEVEDN
jgi:FtsP/CotA-like multicopper oxidase with cupredoxin domain